MWKDEVVLKLKDSVLKTRQKAENGPDSGSVTENMMMNDQNWERVFIKADKFTGSLRYTTSKQGK